MASSIIQQNIDSLNEEQREVALCRTHCLAIAAPGSGKTKTLAVKAALLLDKGNTVAAVTFTRDAAIELRDRIIALAGPQMIPSLLVGTFHSIDLLMAFPGKAKTGMGSHILSKGFSKLTRQWEIVKEGTRRGLVARAIDAAGLDLDVEEGTRLIEALKSGHQKPDTQNHQALVDTYSELLKRHGVIDFQDILLLTNRGISSGQISPLQTDHLMIDEFQDTDATQFQWAMHHADAGCVVTAVGDDDQSIYGFRRALGYQGMMEFNDRLQATRIVLGMNYRSHCEVLTPSSQLIERNQDRMSKQLVSFKGPGGSVVWDRFGSRVDEAKAVQKWSAKALQAGQTVGILARTNKRLDEVEAQLLRAETPYTRSEGGSIINSREMSVFMAALGLIARNDIRDADEVLAWCKLNEEEISSLHKALGNGGFYGLTKDALGRVAVSSQSRTVISSIVKRFSDWRVILDSGGINFVLDGVHEFLASYCAEDKRAAKGLETVREVFRRPVEIDQIGTSEVLSRMERIRALQSSKSSKSDGGANAGAVLMTAHGSKGLEYDFVWIVGAEDGCFPDTSASLQEERRLFFVAMTRAKAHLFVSASGAKPLSPFIDEAQILRNPETDSEEAS